MAAHVDAPPRRTTLCRLALATMVVAMLAIVPPAGAAQVGTVPDLTWGVSHADVDRTVASMQDAGVRWVRMNASWAAIEPNGKGVYDAAGLAAIDYAVDKARSAGIDVIMPIADGVPYWASADPNKSTSGGARSWNRYWRPTSFQDYADVVGWVARRYSARGVHTFEIWNEPNLNRFWPSGPNPAEYLQMLRPAAAAVHAADPAGRVLLGGLAGNDYNWLDRLYAAGAQGAFDAVAVHPYTGYVDPTLCWNQAGTTRKAKDAFCGLEEIHASMVAAGDGNKAVWLTEFGWSSSTSTYGVSESTQADFMTKAFKKLESYPWVPVACWYTYRNLSWYGDDPASWDAQTGVLRTDFTPKPAFTAMKSYAQAGGSGTPTPTPTASPTPTPAPAVDLPPAVTLTAPGPGTTFSGSLALQASASDDHGIARVEFLIDGKLVTSDSSAPYATTWKAPRKLAYGAHTVSARAVDSSGQATTTAAVSVTRARSTTTTLTAYVAARGTRVTAVVRGRVRGGHRGRVRVHVLRRGSSGRHAVAQVTRSGRFTVRLPLPGRQRYRIRASYSGAAGAAPSRSRPVRLSLRV
jgi:hypothetical protein